MSPKIRLAVSLALIAAGCSDPMVDRPDCGIECTLFDASGMLERPLPPVVEPVPAALPFVVATLRGTAPASMMNVRPKRVIVESAGNPLATTVLPDGSFCIDAPMRMVGSYQFRLFTQGEDGTLSDEAAIVNTAFDPGAAEPPNAQTCTGADPRGCVAGPENCTDGRDNDCDGRTDMEDDDCATCDDDVLEENDDLDAPRVDPGRYDNLTICPSNPDYYGIFLRRDDELVARAFFSHAGGNLDMALLTLAGGPIAVSTSVTDDESISHTATAAGEVKLRIAGDEGVTNSYTLDIRVIR